MNIRTIRLVAIFPPILSMIVWSGSALYEELLCSCYNWKFYFALIGFTIFLLSGLLSAYIVFQPNQNKHEI